MKQKVYSKHYNSLAELKRAVLETLVSTARQYVQQLDA